MYDQLVDGSWLRQLVDGYSELLERQRDRRMDQFPLMSSPLVPLSLCLTYVWIVCGIGPRLMRQRTAFHFPGLLVVYNALQVALSMYIFYSGLAAGWLGRYNVRCEPVDYSRTFSAHQAVWLCWIYFFSKFTEFFDTFFFVLRKKFDHISLLHLVHHGLMPFSVWWGARFVPGGHSTFFGLINTYVHVVMYTYYMIAALGPNYSSYIWWKKYLTAFQMLQFVAVGIHAFQLFFRECDFPTAAAVYIGAHGMLYLSLFANFYRQQYVLRRNKVKNADTHEPQSAVGYRKPTAMTDRVSPRRSGSTEVKRRFRVSAFVDDNNNDARSP